MKRVAATLVLLLVLVFPTVASGPRQAAGTLEKVDVYVALMDQAPAVTLRGGGTAPGVGPGSVRARSLKSAKVRNYRKNLTKAHNQTLQAVGVRPVEKIYDYTMALNGFAAKLTASQAAELAKQPGVVLVQRDQMRHILTDAAPRFLGLTDPAGPWD